MRWLAVAGLVAAAVAVGLVVTNDDTNDSPGAASSTSTPQLSPLAAAADHANVQVSGVSSIDVQDMIKELCTSRKADPLATKVVSLGVIDPDDIREVVEGVGDGAEQYCPDVAAEDPQLINDAYGAALSTLAKATTTSARPTSG